MAGGNDRPAGGEQRRREARTDQREASKGRRKQSADRGERSARRQEAIRADGKRATAAAGDLRPCDQNQPLRRGVLASKLQRPAGYGPRRPTNGGPWLRRTGRWMQRRSPVRQNGKCRRMATGGRVGYILYLSRDPRTDVLIEVEVAGEDEAKRCADGRTNKEQRLVLRAKLLLRTRAEAL
ncbi:hypothetical protein Scep_004463 [Stephania cephalantha]|uniref:Uncharacterized protein n=1 Tax=Stephania cephalantha TaxID=152367 RepID=A0AAP0KVD0_9MAGN